MIKQLDAHISSLTEDSNMSFGTLCKIIESIECGDTTFKEKIDGQNFTIGFDGKKFVQMGKGNPDFSKAKTMKDIHEDIYKILMLHEGYNIEYLNVKRHMLDNLSNLNRKIKELGENFPNIPAGGILECAIVYENTKNYFSYEVEGVVLLDTIGFELSKKQTFQLGLNYLPELYIDQDAWSPIFSYELRSFIMENYSLDDSSTIADFALEEVKKILYAEIGIPFQHLDAFSRRIIEKNKSVAKHTLLKNKSIWKKFQAAEKKGYIYRKAINEIDIFFAKFLNKMFLLTRYEMCDTEFPYKSKHAYDSNENPIRLTYNMFLQHSDTEEDVKDIIDSELSLLESMIDDISPIEGIVFTYENKRYKITGGFTPANKLNSLSRY